HRTPGLQSTVELWWSRYQLGPSQRPGQQPDPGHDAQLLVRGNGRFRHGDGFSTCSKFSINNLLLLGLCGSQASARKAAVLSDIDKKEYAMKLTDNELLSMKSKAQIPILTAYTTPIARCVEQAGVSAILVG